MKSIIVVLIALCIVLQYQLWFADGGLFSAWQQQGRIDHQQRINTKLKQHNELLAADIHNLKYNNSVIEGHARNELGMIKPGEQFYQVVTHRDYVNP